MGWADMGPSIKVILLKKSRSLVFLSTLLFPATVPAAKKGDLCLLALILRIPLAGAGGRGNLGIGVWLSILAFIHRIS
jgi:hypothetical protein